MAAPMIANVSESLIAGCVVMHWMGAWSDPLGFPNDDWAGSTFKVRRSCDVSTPGLLQFLLTDQNGPVKHQPRDAQLLITPRRSPRAKSP
jgi:hypothetical protein